LSFEETIVIGKRREIVRFLEENSFTLLFLYNFAYPKISIGYSYEVIYLRKLVPVQRNICFRRSNTRKRRKREKI